MLTSVLITITFQVCVLHDVDNVISGVDLRRPVRPVLRHEGGGLVGELHRETLRVHDVPVKDVELKRCTEGSVWLATGLG